MRRGRVLAVVAAVLMTGCDGGSAAAPTTGGKQTIAERFDEAGVIAAGTELATATQEAGLTLRDAELFFQGCRYNSADEQFAGRPHYFYRFWVWLDAPIGPGVEPLDLERIGDEAARAAGWSAPSQRGMRARAELKMRQRPDSPRLLIEVTGPCLEVVDEDAAEAHTIGAGRRTLELPGLVELTDQPLALEDGTYLPAGDPAITVPDG